MERYRLLFALACSLFVIFNGADCKKGGWSDVADVEAMRRRPDFRLALVLYANSSSSGKSTDLFKT